MIVKNVRDIVATRIPISHNVNTMLKRNSTKSVLQCYGLKDLEHIEIYIYVSSYLKWDEWTIIGVDYYN